MKTSVGHQQEIIQINLYTTIERIPSATKVLSIGLSLSVAAYLLISIFLSQTLLLTLSASLGVLISTILYYYYETWFPESHNALIIAFNELQLIEGEEIIYLGNLQEIHCKQIATPPFEILEINGIVFPKITIAYVSKRGKKWNHPHFRTDYIIYKKVDWWLLQNRLQNRLQMQGK